MGNPVVLHVLKLALVAALWIGLERMLDKRRKLTKSWLNFLLGFTTFMAAIQALVLFSNENGMYAEQINWGLFLLSVACLVGGNHLVFYQPDQPTTSKGVK